MKRDVCLTKLYVNVHAHLISIPQGFSAVQRTTGFHREEINFLN